MSISTLRSSTIHFQSITKIGQHRLAVTFETFDCIFLVPQNCVYNKQHFYFKGIQFLATFFAQKRAYI